MVSRITVLILFILLFVSPVAAQVEDVPRVEIGFGYSNYGLTDGGGKLRRLNGVSMHNTINLDSWIGLENYTGVYSAPINTTLIINVFGVKLVARDLVDGRLSPYLIASAGVGYLTSNVRGRAVSALATRVGGGIDFNLTGGMAFKVDVSSMSINDVNNDGEAASKLNISTGIVFNIGN